MADSETYIHPIIQAMVDSANLKSRAISQQNQSDQAKEQAEFRRKQLAEVVKRAEEEHQLNKQRLDFEQKTQAANHDLAVQQFMHLAKHGVLEDIAAGIQNPDTLPTAPSIPTTLNSQPGNPTQVTASPASVAPAPNFSQMPAPGPSSSQDGNVDVAGTAMPRAAVAAIPAQVAAVAGNKAKAIAEAQDAAKLPNQTAAADAAYKRALDLEDRRAKSAENVARINAAAGHDRSELSLLARMMAVNGGMMVDPDVAASKYDAILNGQTGYTSLSKAEKAAVDKIAATRGTSLPTNQAAYSKKLDQLAGIQDLVDQYRSLAANYSKDSPSQPDATTFDKAVKGVQHIPLVGRFVDPTNIPGTDLKSKADALKAQGGALASYFDQQNRKSDAEILRQFGGLFDAKATTAQNLDKIESHLQALRKSVKGNFAGVNAQDVANVLSNRGAHDLLESMNSSGSKPLTSAIAHQLLVEAHGNNEAALQLATQRGYDVSKIVQ
jgi:hypothetical protein